MKYSNNKGKDEEADESGGECEDSDCEELFMR